MYVAQYILSSFLWFYMSFIGYLIDHFWTVVYVVGDRMDLLKLTTT